ncbi:HET-domain-containing protein [Lophiostoma macrostomum CBS 122681]|uniref:HET-domain-containing protein n=1 Tax=Lophiostoma macrostomum CBS 122681 TaxID=1314788 RepID=A0A6A6SWE4_9PLEO|nr:HET-domain-containing protein [Lophiostoma macrostomum CBS 122681]
MSTFKYRKLKGVDIRVLKLLPGRFDDPLKAAIKHVPLSEPVKTETTMLSLEELQETVPEEWKVSQTLDGRYIFYGLHGNSWIHPDPSFDEALYYGYADDYTPDPACMYEALSYVWGVEESNAYLHIKSTWHPISQRLPLKTNLETALRHLRYRDRPRTLWIDAICINQQNIAERNEQVHRMGSIYRRASRVVVWLGEAASDGDLAMSAMHYLGQQVDVTKDFWLLRHPEAVEMQWFKRDVHLPYEQTLWTALEHLFGRAWFERLWVVQEIVMANRHSIVQCGDDSVPWPLFRNAIDLMSQKSLPSKLLHKRVGDAETLTYGQTREMVHLLETARVKKCFDPRDKIYGLINLAHQDFASLIKPDYLLSPQVVFRDIFLRVLEHSRRLNFLRFVSGEGSSGLPSWVPDWNPAPNSAVLDSKTFSLASGYSRAQYEYLEPDKLRVAGVLAGVIESVEHPFSDDIELFTQTLKRIIIKICGDTSYTIEEHSIVALTATLASGESHETFPNAGLPTSDLWKQYLFTGIESEARTMHMRRLVANLHGRSFFQTSDGGYGIGPAGTRKGDIVAVILGCDFPMILRPNAKDSLEFSVVGECYVHGVMFGEAILGPLSEQHGCQMVRTQAGYEIIFRNEYGDRIQDPRLGPLDERWERLRVVHEPSEAEPNYYRDRLTGVEINCDPRMLPDALIARGVSLKYFTLV